MWRIVTFNFEGKFGTASGSFGVEVDNSGVPITEPGSTDCKYVNISGDPINICRYPDTIYEMALRIRHEGGGVDFNAILSKFPKAVEGQTYTELECEGTWSYTLGSITTYTITASAGTGGSISPSGSVSVIEGSSQAFTITPASGYQVASVLVDGIEAKQDLVNNVYTFTNVSAVHTIATSFEELCTAVIEVSINSTGTEGQKSWDVFMAKIDAWGYYISNTFNSETGTGTITITETDTFPDDVFKSQTNITSVVLPDCFTEIREAAFTGCSNMVSITLPDTMQVIGAYSFLECTSLTSLELPASVTEVGEGFLDTCDSLEEVICLAPVPPTTGSTISTLTLPELRVPNDSINLYLGSPVWSSAFNVISPIKPSPVRGFGFNLTKMVDVDYKDELRDWTVYRNK